MSKIVENLKYALALEDGSLSWQLALWSVIFGIIIAMVAFYYNKKIIGSFVRAVLAAGACSPETAKSAAELGQSDNIFALKRLKKESSPLRRVVSIAQNGAESEANAEASAEADETRSAEANSGEARYFISPEMNERATKQYDERGSSALVLVISIFGLIVAGLVLYFALPALLNMFNK